MRIHYTSVQKEIMKLYLSKFYDKQSDGSLLACCRLFRLKTYDQSPPVDLLQVHRPDGQNVICNANANIRHISDVWRLYWRLRSLISPYFSHHAY